MVDRCSLPSSQLHVSALMAIFRLMIFNKNTHKHLHMACVLYMEDGGAGLLDGGTRSRVYWVGRGVYTGVYISYHILYKITHCVSITI